MSLTVPLDLGAGSDVILDLPETTESVSVTSCRHAAQAFDGFGEAKFLRALASIFTIRSPDQNACLEPGVSSIGATTVR